MGNSESQDVELSPEERARLSSLRYDLAERYKYIAMVIGLSSFLSVLFGIPLIIFGYEGGLPTTAGVPIWSGIVLCVAAGFGTAASRNGPVDKTNSYKSKQGYYISVFYSMAAWSIWHVCMCLGYSLWTLVECSRHDPENERCPTNFDILFALNSIIMVTATFNLGSTIAVCVLYYRYYRNIKIPVTEL